MTLREFSVAELWQDDHSRPGDANNVQCLVAGQPIFPTIVKGQ